MSQAVAETENTPKRCGGMEIHIYPFQDTGETAELPGLVSRSWGDSLNVAYRPGEVSPLEATKHAVKCLVGVRRVGDKTIDMIMDYRRGKAPQKPEGECREFPVSVSMSGEDCRGETVKPEDVANFMWLDLVPRLAFLEKFLEGLGNDTSLSAAIVARDARSLAEACLAALRDNEPVEIAEGELPTLEAHATLVEHATLAVDTTTSELFFLAQGLRERIEAEAKAEAQ